MIYYTIYKTTNKVNDKFYIGKHQTTNLDDGYLGSGKRLRYAIDKYGINNFIKEIIHILESLEEMNAKEREIVNEEFLTRDDTYNLKLGGGGGWENISPDDKSKGAKIMNEIVNSDPEYNERRRIRSSLLFKRLHKEGKFTYDNFKGKHHTEESKSGTGEKNSKHQLGSGNSQYGTCWIYHEQFKESKKILSVNLDYWLEEGWIKGRKIKF